MRGIILIIISTSYFLMGVSSCEELTRQPLSEAEVARGLKEALRVATEKSVRLASQEGGYLTHPVIRIPFPEAGRAYSFMKESPILNPLLEEFELLLNRAAEDAAHEAMPIILDAITNITIQDAWDILKGSNDAATNYLQRKTYTQLYDAYKPEVSHSLSSVGALGAWRELSGAYNKLAVLNPNLEPINTDLADYTTGLALDGLFYLIREEEREIRNNPAARINDLLRRVFAQQ